MSAARLTLLTLFAIGCGDEDGLAWRRSVEILAVTDEARLVDLRVVEGNTGVERHQGLVRLERWVADGAAITYARRSLAAHTAREAGVFGVEDDRLERSASGYAARLHSGELNARVRVEGLEPGAVDQTGGWGGAWQTATLDGWIEAGARGGRVHGPALVIEREGAPGRGPRRLLYLRGDALELLVDEQGGRRAGWLRQGGGPRGPLPDDLALDLDAWGQGAARAPSLGLAVELRLGPAHGSTALHDHLSEPERLIADAWTGRAERRLSLVEARAATTAAPKIHTTGLFLAIGPATDQPATRRRWSSARSTAEDG